MTKPITTLLAAALLLFTTACRSVENHLAESEAFAARGNYYLAYKVLEAARDPDDPDPELERAYWAARLEFLIDRGKHEMFADDEEAALADFNRALKLAPENEVLPDLIAKCKRKLADRAVRKGDRLWAEGDLEGALLAYTEAQRHVAGYAAAIDGTQKVRDTFQSMRQKAQLHFLEALRVYPELRWVQVEWHTDTALANDPGRDDAKALRQRAEHRLAERSLLRAAEAEKARHYGAALLEYKAAAESEPAYPGIQEHIVQMQREVDAENLGEKAQAALVNKDFAAARKHLEQAFQLTILEKASVSDLLLQVRKGEGRYRYQQARDQELQNHKAEALQAYRELIEAWPDGLADEKARADNLQSDIDNAQKEWDAAEAAEQQGKLEEALQHYRSVHDFYPDWRDVGERIARLAQQIQK